MEINIDQCKRALSHLGVKQSITSIDEETVEAEMCSLFYQIALEDILRGHEWQKFSKREELAELEDTPNDSWEYCYREPSDCVAFRRIDSGQRMDDEDSAIEFIESRDSDGAVILTDQGEAVGEYTMLVDDVTKWDADFKLSHSFLMAHLMAPSLTGGDPYKLGDKCLQEHAYWLGRAKANDKKEQQKPRDLASGFTRSR